jgi:hypothetical protein
MVNPEITQVPGKLEIPEKPKSQFFKITFMS